MLQIETGWNLFTGMGCASPDLEVTGETDEQVEHAINNIIIPFLLGKNPLNYIRILHELKPLLPHQSSALAMVDMALFDLFAKKSKVPLFKFLGGYRKSTTAQTFTHIGILPFKQVNRLKQIFGILRKKNVLPIIKLKGGINLAEDVEKVIRINELFPDLILRFDANQGYSLAEALSFFHQTKHVGIQIFEQPTKIQHSYKLGEITKQYCGDTGKNG
ncbi:MAG: enolase C-terminal domain-like protein [Flavobacteriaceae bacterium]|nr:enolase C-terminal domain-like protein [Flavobacteriaceae bacterium]